MSPEMLVFLRMFRLPVYADYDGMYCPPQTVTNTTAAMPIPELELHRVEKLLAEYCERRVPPHARDSVLLDIIIRGDTITLVERRPHFRDKSRSTTSNIARFVYDGNGTGWRLECRDGKGRWHPYPRVETTRRFEDLIEEVNADPAAVFWG
jgi:hypothetical protein